MSHKIVFSASGPHRRGEEKASGHFQIRYQALCATADIFKLLPLDQPRPCWSRGMRPLWLLDARLFIGADHVDPLGMQRWSLGI